ncbi:PRA1 family protein 2 [Ambystoma mexicanum]|uniref:PRA1 family protein 2 n=1 Tax=Ambystoma mexicanum TaxID=8296 RepID=UPI0037E96A3D
MSEVQLPPVRTLEDFVLGSARFSPPDIRDFQRWNHRVINNLLYYQSNYCLLQLLLLSLGGYIQPLKTLLVLLVVALAFLGFVWAAENKAVARRFRRNYPTSCMLAILGGSYCLLSLLGAVAAFLVGVILPLLLILTHASLRLRNLKSKIENKMESIGLKRTPMGMLLEALGQEQEAGS